MTRYDTPRTAPGAGGLEVNTAIVTPTDRIRWGPIVAGVFAALTVAAVLSTLGAAVGMSAYDRNDSARSFALGAGVWGAITMLVAFAVGGWLAARSAAIRGRNNGLLNGVMVAGVGIPLLMFLIGSAGALMSHAELSNGRDTRAEQRMTNSGPAAGFDGATQAGASMSAHEDASTQDRAAKAERASETGSRAAWSTLMALLLAIGASAVGGYLGTRDDDRPHDDRGIATA